MFWKKEVKKEDTDLAESIAPSLDKLTAKIDKINALVDFLMESKKVETEKFARINEQVGELRGEIAEREKKVQSLEAEATRASELVKAVQPEKFLSKIEKEDVKIEIVKAKVNNQEKISNEIIKEMKDIKRLITTFRGTEQVLELNQEIKDEITTAKKILTNVDINASKVEKLFTDFNKQYLELKSIKEDAIKVNVLFLELKKDFDAIKVNILSLGKVQEVINIEKIRIEQKNAITELIKERDKFRKPMGELKGVLGEIKNVEKSIKLNKEHIEHIVKESQQRHIIFQDLFLQFQKDYQKIKQKESKEEQKIIELKEYIRESLINKIKKSTIRKELLKRGWNHDIIETFI